MSTAEPVSEPRALLIDIKDAFIRYGMTVDDCGEKPIAHRELMHRLDAALAALSHVQAPAEPAAWRAIQSDPLAGWHLSVNKPTPIDGFTYEPLYTVPVAYPVQEPKAYLIEHEGRFNQLSFHPLTEADKKHGFREIPLYASTASSPQIDEAMVERDKTVRECAEVAYEECLHNPVARKVYDAILALVKDCKS